MTCHVESRPDGYWLILHAEGREAAINLQHNTRGPIVRMVLRAVAIQHEQRPALEGAMNYTLTYEETGEVRPPRAGEWFRGYNGGPDQARFDFSCQAFPILRQLLKEAPEDTEAK